METCIDVVAISCDGFLWMLTKFFKGENTATAIDDIHLGQRVRTSVVLDGLENNIFFRGKRL